MFKPKKLKSGIQLNFVDAGAHRAFNYKNIVRPSLSYTAIFLTSQNETYINVCQRRISNITPFNVEIIIQYF